MQYTVEVTRPGPLLLRLRLDVSERWALVLGYDSGTDGAKGECEACGLICENDILESINGISLEGRSLKDILLQISRVSREPGSRCLTFRRPAGASAGPDKAEDSPPHISLLPLPPALPAPPAAGSGRPLQFRTLLRETLINEGRLRNLSSQGLPDKLGLRGVIWRLLLKYLPLETGTWPQYLREQREEYAAIAHELIQTTPYTSPYTSNPSSPSSPLPGAVVAAPEVPKPPVHVDDDPLRYPDESAWPTYYQDLALMDEIQKDVVRTHPDINFFNSDPQGSCQAVMQRILFVYAKKQPLVRYVQGMNELCGTLYYVFASDEDEEWARHAEADTYHCFSLLVEEMQDVFIRQRDSTESGIIGRIKQFVVLLQRHDPALHDLLDSQGVDPAFYGLRWLTTILSREFNLADTIRLWDTLFSDTDRNAFLSYLCCTMILEQRERLVKGDFAENLSLLQDYPDIDIIYLLNKATALRAKDATTGEGMNTSLEYVDEPDAAPPHQRVLASFKSAAQSLRVAAGSSISDIKSSAAQRLAVVSVGVRQMIAEGRETLSERVPKGWWIGKDGGKEADDITPY